MMHSTATPDLRLVLVEPSHPGNIGAAARAMRTMGLRQLVLVNPHAFPHAEASAMAAGADDVLAAARVCARLDEAIGDCRFVLGCSARRRHVPLTEHSPREAASALWTHATHGPAALLFGRERTGLTNDELMHCNGSVFIPSDPEFSSLNLAASVQVLSYELRLRQLGAPVQAGPATAPERDEPPATHAQMEGLFGHFDQTLHDIDFHKGRAPDTVMQRLRRLLLRAEPDQREVRVLRGILSDAQRMARLARAAGAVATPNPGPADPAD
ncbi:RNA methyltransferase [Chiayiivirga flava]|uniref:tRNA (cytidine/uridine-2'-O-)-methyltransferase TrmJ n=1 Tax=Chiayiivirga flava TaxID=659595 RepID=A0A7W8D5U0_9GAMM|nr:TrmH family RNA methyltransferase [Chiayiivirga flava]